MWVLVQQQWSSVSKGRKIYETDKEIKVKAKVHL